jgi:hypothetical protein
MGHVICPVFIGQVCNDVARDIRQKTKPNCSMTPLNTSYRFVLRALWIDQMTLRIAHPMMQIMFSILEMIEKRTIVIATYSCFRNDTAKHNKKMGKISRK